MAGARSRMPRLPSPPAGRVRGGWLAPLAGSPQRLFGWTCPLCSALQCFAVHARLPSPLSRRPWGALPRARCGFEPRAEPATRARRNRGGTPPSPVGMCIVCLVWPPSARPARPAYRLNSRVEPGAGRAGRLMRMTPWRRRGLGPRMSQPGSFLGPVPCAGGSTPRRCCSLLTPPGVDGPRLCGAGRAGRGGGCGRFCVEPWLRYGGGSSCGGGTLLTVWMGSWASARVRAPSLSGFGRIDPVLVVYPPSGGPAWVRTTAGTRLPGPAATPHCSTLVPLGVGQ